MTIVRNLAKIELLLIVLTLMAYFYTEPYLPLELREYLNVEEEAALSATESIVFSLLIIAVLVYLLSLFGLLGARSWARAANIYSTMIIFPLCFFIGPSVGHGVAYALDQLAVLVQGMLFALLAFSNSYQKFARIKLNAGV